MKNIVTQIKQSDLKKSGFAKKIVPDGFKNTGTISKSLSSFFSGFAPHFQSVRYSYQRHAFDYFQSLFKLEKNKVNCQEIADTVSDLDQQRINHFINSTHWSSRALMKEIADEASRLFGAEQQAVGLLIDEVGFRKKGKMSACVGRQYLGCIGKTENGQVAVAAGLSQGEHYAPMDMRLFMPKDWGEDVSRRKKCNIPKQEKHLSKPQMAKKIISDAVKNDIQFDYVSFDALYGNATDLLTYLDGQGLSFVGDVRSNFMLYFNGDIGEMCTVGKFVSNLLDGDFDNMDIRKSTKGKLSAKFHYAKVNVLNTNDQWLDLILLVRKDTDGNIKYSLSNMHENHIKELAERQAQRVYVEQLFKDGKNLVGLGDYQIRGWHGFHNHMAMCMMAMLLIAKVKMEYDHEKFTAPMLQKIFKTCIQSKMDNPDIALNIIFEQNDRYIRQLQKDGYFQDDS